MTSIESIIKSAEQDAQFEKIKSIIKKVPDINAALVQNELSKAFLSALENKNLERIKFLADNGFNIEWRDIDNDTTFTKAVRFGNLDVVKYLITKSYKLTSSEREFLLTEANKRGYVEIFKFINNYGESDNYVKNNSHLLKAALDNKDLEMAKILIENGADINFQYNHMGSALDHFAGFNHKDLTIVKFLLQNGANIYRPVRYVTICDKTELYYDMLKLLYENGAKIEVLNKEERLDVSMIEFLISKRKKPNYLKRDEGVENVRGLNDYLILNAKIPDAVSFLLKHGCDVNYVCPYTGDTALILASKSLALDSVRILISHGAKVGYVNNDGHNALFYAQEASTLVGKYRDDYDNVGYMKESYELNNKKREIIKLLSR